jgi:hypothetical protein
MAAAFVLLGFAIAWRLAEDQIGPRLLRLSFETLAICTVAALAVTGMAWLASGGGPITTSPPRLAVIRTLVICLAALALALSGSRWKRVELVWLAYAAIAFCTLKLLFEDLRQGTLGSMAVSLFLYGMVWVMVPRLIRAGTEQEESTTERAKSTQT